MELSASIRLLDLCDAATAGAEMWELLRGFLHAIRRIIVGQASEDRRRRDDDQRHRRADFNALTRATREWQADLRLELQQAREMGQKANEELADLRTQHTLLGVQFAELKIEVSICQHERERLRHELAAVQCRQHTMEHGGPALHDGHGLQDQKLIEGPGEGE